MALLFSPVKTSSPLFLTEEKDRNRWPRRQLFMGTGFGAASIKERCICIAAPGKLLFLPDLSYIVMGVFPGFSFAYSSVYSPLVCGNDCP